MSDDNFEATTKINAAPQMQAGQVLFNGRYVLKNELGRGGMGVVWRADDKVLGREVALKVLPASMANDEDALADLKREAARSQMLTHSNIVRVHDLILDGAQPAIAMEFVDGASLAKRKNEQPNRCFAPEALVPWIQQFAEALDYAHHKAKVVHHDLKPANLMVGANGELKIADFGIARSLGETQARLTGKTGGGIAGTMSYMSPQQLLGEQPSASDDIYSFGATLYELLTSKPPFFSGDISTQARTVVPPTASARRAELLPPEANMPAIPALWDEVIASCLAKSPDERPKSAGEIASKLSSSNEVDSDATVKISNPVRTAQNSGSPTKSRKLLYICLGVVGIAVVGIILGIALGSSGEPPKPEQRISGAAQTPSFPGAIKPLNEELPKTPGPAKQAAHPAQEVSDRPSTPQTPSVVPQQQQGSSTQPTTMPEPAGSISARITPAAIVAQVSFLLDGKPFAANDGRLEGVSAGEHELSITHPDYETVTEKVRIADKQELRIDATLTPKDASVAITTNPAGAQASFMRTLKRFQGAADVAIEPGDTPVEWKLPPGQHQLRFQKAGYLTAFKTVTLTPNQKLRLSITLEKQPSAKP